jgi:hypothetical protein
MGKKVRENAGSERIANEEGHSNTHQSPYFFNIYLKVYTVTKSTNENYTYQGGIYNDQE